MVCLLWTDEIRKNPKYFLFKLHEQFSNFKDFSDALKILHKY